MNAKDVEAILGRLHEGIFDKDVAVAGDLTVGDDLTVTGAAAVTETLAVTGAVTGTNNSNGTAAGAGLLSTGAGAPTVKVMNVNGEIITVIKVDLTGLGSKSDDNDVIGLVAGGAAYLTKITTAINGLIYRTEMTCLELPTASANPALDIDLMADAAATGVYDTDGAAYTAIITAGGNWAAYMTKEAGLAAATQPVADSYLYLCDGATHTGTSVFTGGQFQIKLYGTKLMTP
jgi:hypothetical protein